MISGPGGQDHDRKSGIGAPLGGEDAAATMYLMMDEPQSGRQAEAIAIDEQPKLKEAGVAQGGPAN